MKTILVIRTSAMGDVAMTSPVIKNLLAAYPNVRVVMLTRSFFAPFFEENERLIIYNADLHGKHKGIRGIRKLYKELKKEYDFNFVADLHDKLYSKLLTIFFKVGGIKTFRIDKGRAEKRALTRKSNKILEQLRPTVLRYADVFEKAGLHLRINNSGLVKTERDIPSIFPLKDENWVGISPFAQHAGKMIPIPTIKQVIKKLEMEYPETKVFIFGGGESEAKMAAEMETEFMNTISVIGKVKLIEEMDMIANMDVMISMDSSAMHMASLVGTKVVSAWGATHPYAGFMGVGQSEENAVQIDLKCRPCSVYGNKPCHRKDYACLNQISAEMIMDKVSRILNDPMEIG